MSVRRFGSKKEAQIIDSLREEIKAGQFTNGQRLILSKLARRFECAWTPVHNSLTELTEEGLIIRKGTGMRERGIGNRYFVNYSENLQGGSPEKR